MTEEATSAVLDPALPAQVWLSGQVPETANYAPGSRRLEAGGVLDALADWWAYQPCEPGNLALHVAVITTRLRDGIQDAGSHFAGLNATRERLAHAADAVAAADADWVSGFSGKDAILIRGTRLGPVELEGSGEILCRLPGGTIVWLDQCDEHALRIVDSALSEIQEDGPYRFGWSLSTLVARSAPEIVAAAHPSKSLRHELTGGLLEVAFAGSVAAKLHRDANDSDSPRCCRSSLAALMISGRQALADRRGLSPQLSLTSLQSAMNRVLDMRRAQEPRQIALALSELRLPVKSRPGPPTRDEDDHWAQWCLHTGTLLTTPALRPYHFASATNDSSRALVRSQSKDAACAMARDVRFVNVPSECELPRIIERARTRVRAGVPVLVALTDVHDIETGTVLRDIEGQPVRDFNGRLRRRSSGNAGRLSLVAASWVPQHHTSLRAFIAAAHRTRCELEQLLGNHLAALATAELAGRPGLTLATGDGLVGCCDDPTTLWAAAQHAVAVTDGKLTSGVGAAWWMPGLDWERALDQAVFAQHVTKAFKGTGLARERLCVYGDVLSEQEANVVVASFKQPLAPSRSAADQDGTAGTHRRQTAVRLLAHWQSHLPTGVGAVLRHELAAHAR